MPPEEDQGQEEQTLHERLEALHRRISNIERALIYLVTLGETTVTGIDQLEIAMSQQQSDQQHLDQDVAALQASNSSLTQSLQTITSSIQALATQVASLKSQPGAESLDFTAIDAAVADITTAATGTATEAQAADQDAWPTTTGS